MARAFGIQRASTKEMRRRTRRLLLEPLESRIALASIEQLRLFTAADLQTAGLMGSYVNQSLRSATSEDDWRSTQTISGSRVDQMDFDTSAWGSRAEVGITGGSDENWDHFSVQWDGYLQVLNDNTTLRTRSDDGSRLWVDANGDGQFGASSTEFANNGFGAAQPARDGALIAPLAKGVYRIRVQYETAGGANIMRISSGPALRLRIAYLIPANRTPQTEGVKNLRNIARWYQDFLREEMDRHGYGKRTIAYETESDGATPKINVLTLPYDDSYYRADDDNNTPQTIYDRVLEGARGLGIPPFQQGELWLYVHEAHLQHPDGRVVGGVALGAGNGNGWSGGVGVVAATKLSFADVEGLADQRSYDGLIVSEIGPYPLKQDVSFPWFEGKTISSVASSQVGAALHEMSHGLGIGHGFRNDANFHGALMGNGFRGFRSFVWPELFTTDRVGLGAAEALGLSFSRFLNPENAITDTTAPIIESLSVNPSPQAGQLEVSVTASDNASLGAALLRRNGEYIAQMPLAGNSATFTFQVPQYDPGQSNIFNVALIDAQGNRSTQEVTATPAIPPNRAPLPFVAASAYTLSLGQAVTLSAANSSDPNHSVSQLTVEWDLDGNGVFDTNPTTSKTLTAAFDSLGVRRITARITDPAGAFSISAPLTIRVGRVWHNPHKRLDVSGDGFVVAADALDVINFLNAFSSQPVPTDGRTTGPYFDTTGDAVVAPGDALAVINHLNAFGADKVAAEGEPGFETQNPRVPIAKEGAAVNDLLQLLAIDVSHASRRKPSMSRF